MKKCLLAALLALVSLSALPEEDHVWRSLNFAPDQRVTKLEIATGEMYRSTKPKTDLRMGLFKHTFASGLVIGTPGAVYGMRYLLVDCQKNNVVIVIASLFDKNDVKLGQVTPDIEVLPASTDSLFEAEAKGLCSAPMTELKPLDSEKPSLGKPAKRLPRGLQVEEI